MPGHDLEPGRTPRTRRVHMEYGGGMDTVIGWGSVATPGAFAGFQLACERYGELPWREVLRPAIDATARGFPVSTASAEYLGYAHAAVFGWHPESHAILHHDDGTPVGVGDTVHLPELSATLRTIAEEGAAALYEGALAQRVADAVGAGGGLVTRADLAAYRPIVREPVRLQLAGWDVATNPAPALGGVVLGALLLLLEGLGFPGWDATGVAEMTRIQDAVLSFRVRELLGAPDRIRAAERLLHLARVGELRGLLGAPNTVHTSAVDSEGTACAITVSAGYGSGAVVPGTGFWLNNSLGEIELIPPRLLPLDPGVRLPSNMAPTVARRADGSVLAIGSPGAERITTALASVLLNFLHLDMSLSDAVAHARLHVERFEGRPTVALEPGLPVDAIEGWHLRRFPDRSMYFGGVQAALWEPGAGLFGAADPRRDGAVTRGGTA